MRKVLSLTLIFSFFMNINFAWSKAANKNEKELNLKEFAFPSEVENIAKNAGTVFYSPVIKGKVLIPVHIWGEVQRPGLHFIPIGASLIDGLSMAGGLTAQADTDNIRLSHRKDEKLETKYFDLSEGGDTEAFFTELKPRDTIFAEKSTFREDRSYYTSLVGVIATILSSVLIIDQIKKR